MIKAHLFSGRIISSSEIAFSLNEKSLFGEKLEGSIEYSATEALFLVKQKKMNIFSGKKGISFHDILKKAYRNDKRAGIKFLVYEDIRKKGYIPKSALKFGADFRVYEKGKKPSEEHAKWLVFAVKES